MPDDRPGYPIADFRQIVDDKGLGIPVLTLSQLDALNGVPEDNHIVIRPAIPPLITVHIDPGRRLVALAQKAIRSTAIAPRHKAK